MLGRIIGGGLCAIALVVASAASPALAAPQADAKGKGCKPIYAIAVGGTDSHPNDGGLPEATIHALHSSSKVQFHPLHFPTSSADYTKDRRIAEHRLRQQLRDRSKECSSRRFVLVGYSLGAQIIADVLDSKDRPHGNRIKAVVLYGDPTFKKNRSYDRGSGRHRQDGKYSYYRKSLHPFDHRLRSYCFANDYYCQQQPSGQGPDHGGYAVKIPDAVHFIKASTRL